MFVLFISVNDSSNPVPHTKTVIINGPSQTSFTIAGLVPNTRYRVMIRGFSAAGFGVSKTTDAQTKSNKTTQ